MEYERSRAKRLQIESFEIQKFCSLGVGIEQYLKSTVEDKSIVDFRANPSSQLTGGLDESHAVARFMEPHSTGETSQASAHNDNLVCLNHVRP